MPRPGELHLFDETEFFSKALCGFAQLAFTYPQQPRFWQSVHHMAEDPQGHIRPFLVGNSSNTQDKRRLVVRACRVVQRSESESL